MVRALGLIKIGTQEQIIKIPGVPSLHEIPPKSSNKHNPYPVKNFVHLYIVVNS